MCASCAHKVREVCARCSCARDFPERRGRCAPRACERTCEMHARERARCMRAAFELCAWPFAVSGDACGGAHAKLAEQRRPPKRPRLPQRQG
eukprot:958077-Pleurochrysis_carterae.AAC.1